MFYPSSRIEYWFQQISEIPRPSQHENQISDFIARFAQEHHLTYEQDEVYNVIIEKPASKGHEDKAPLILQAHMDMVPDRKPGYIHDWSKDPILLKEEDGFLKAEGTTLGADDGLGVAWMLAILEDETLIHPPLECIFTVMEEIGLVGARALKADAIRADRLICLDSMNQNACDLCSAGGCYAKAEKQLIMEKNTDPTYCLEISGLSGGHSGTDIHKEKGNAIKIIVRILQEMVLKDIDVKVVSLDGGSKENAIMWNAMARFASCEKEESIRSFIEKAVSAVRIELQESDPGLTFRLNPVDQSAQSADTKSTKELLDFLYLVPDGFQHRSMAIEGLTVTSTNLGVISTKDNVVTMLFLMRSTMDSAVEHLCNMMNSLAQMTDTVFIRDEFFRGWNYDSNSKLRRQFAEVLAEEGIELKMNAEHGGLEVGIFAGLHPGLDIITLGANCTGYHTFEEKLDLKSFAYSYQILRKLITKCAVE